MACYCRPSSCPLVFRKSLANFGCAKPPQFPPADITVELPVPVTVQNECLTNLVQYPLLILSGQRHAQALRQVDTEWVPLGALQRWHEIYLAKLEKDPSFWRRLGSE